MTGRCHCGSVSYEYHGEPIWAGFCHCRTCQRLTGSGHSCSLGAARDRLVIRGETRTYPVPRPDGPPSVRHFCPTCGSQIFGEPGSLPGFISIYAGTLDDPDVFQPTNAIFTRCRPSWDHIKGDLQEFAGHPSEPVAAARPR
ncbi:MAG: GFA family protein [Bauldia sp.]|nr:GFA family protein [Bauldia sp.]